MKSDHPDVQEAQRLFDNGVELSSLSLEKIMMCYYRVPCIRVKQRELNDSRFQRGSSLVYTDKVILVLEPEDIHILPPPVAKHRIIGPRRRYSGLLPGSRIYTRETYTTIQDRDEVKQWRACFRKINADPVLHSRQYSSFFPKVRCFEETGLLGQRAGAHLRKAFVNVLHDGN